MVTLHTKGLVLAGTNYQDKKHREIVARAAVQNEGDVEIIQLFAAQIDTQHLCDILRMTGFRKKKYIVFKQSELFKKANKDVLSNFINERLAGADVFLLFDFDSDESLLTKDPFFMFLQEHLPCTVCRQQESFTEPTFKNLYNALRYRKRNSVFSIVDGLLKEKVEERAPQIMGMLVSFVQNSTVPSKDKVFELFWNTDRIIKTGHCSAQTAIPLLLVKLFRDYLK